MRPRSPASTRPSTARRLTCKWEAAARWSLRRVLRLCRLASSPGGRRNDNSTGARTRSAPEALLNVRVYVEVLVFREMTMVVRSATAMCVGVIGILVTCLSGTAGAQTAADPNPGALTFTGGLDVPSVYVFRGIVQEADRKLTLWPYGDLGLALFSGDGGVKSVGVNLGVWHSLHTGSSGLD